MPRLARRREETDEFVHTTTTNDLPQQQQGWEIPSSPIPSAMGWDNDDYLPPTADTPYMPYPRRRRRQHHQNQQVTSFTANVDAEEIDNATDHTIFQEALVNAFLTGSSSLFYTLLRSGERQPFDWCSVSNNNEESVSFAENEPPSFYVHCMDWIASQPTEAHPSEPPSYVQCQAHCELLRELLLASFRIHIRYWQNATTIAEWTRLLVSRKYPWYICGLWVLHKIHTCAVEALGVISVEYCHFGVLNQLLHKKRIPHLWELVPLREVHRRFTKLTPFTLFQRLFMALNQPKLRGFFKRWMPSLVETCPHWRDDHLTEMQKALVASIASSGAFEMTQTKCLLAFLKHRVNGVDGVTASMVDYAIQYRSPLLFEWLLTYFIQSSHTMTARVFHRWMDTLYSRDVGHTHPTLQSHWACSIFRTMVHTIHSKSTPVEWCDMLLDNGYGGIPTLTRILCLGTLHLSQSGQGGQCGKHWCETVDQWTRNSIQGLPKDGHITYDTDGDDGDDSDLGDRDGEHVEVLDWSELIHDRGEGWFYTLNDTLRDPSTGWTPFFNVLRWGNVQSVMWCLRQGLSIWSDEDECTTEYDSAQICTIHHNPLTLAMCNDDPRVTHVLMKEIDHSWPCLECRETVAHWMTTTGFASALAYHSRSCHSYGGLALFHLVKAYGGPGFRKHKGYLVNWICHYWHWHAQSLRYTSDTDTRLFLPEQGDAWTHPLLVAILSMDSALSSKHVIDVMVDCAMRHQPLVFVSVLNTMCNTYQMGEPQYLIRACLRKPSQIPLSMVFTVMRHPAIVRQLRGTVWKSYRRQLFWWCSMRVHESDSRALTHMLQIAKEEWQWDVKSCMPTSYSTYTRFAQNHSQCDSILVDSNLLPDTHTRLQPSSLQLPVWWTVMLRNGAVPLVMTGLNRLPVLRNTLRAYRLLRRYVQRKIRLDPGRALIQFRHHQMQILLETSIAGGADQIGARRIDGCTRVEE